MFKFVKLMAAVLFLIGSIPSFALKGTQDIKKAMTIAQPKSVYLIIGVRCGEDGFNERFGNFFKDPSVFPVFADVHDPIVDKPGHCLTGNFNDEKELESLANEFANRFDVIITDGADTTKNMNNYNDEFMSLLARALKPDGEIYFHDRFEFDFYEDAAPGFPDELVMSEGEFRDFKNQLPKKLGPGFKKLPYFYFPRTVLKDVTVNEVELNALTERVLEMIASFEPSNFMETVQELSNMGLLKANLIEAQEFAVTAKEDVKRHIAEALQENSFYKHKFPAIVEELKSALQSSARAALGQIFSVINIVSLENDAESLAIVRPRIDRGVDIIVDKFKK